MKVSKIAHTLVLDSVEMRKHIAQCPEEQAEEPAFNTPKLVVHKFVQDFYTLNTLPYQTAIADWKAQNVRYGQED
jgi:hypothetical protein